jgi:hypothetical protein
MTLEETLNSLKEAFTGKSAEAEAHAVALAAKETALTEALAATELLKANSTALEAKVVALETELADAKKIVESAIAAKASAEAKIESAGKKAAAIAASVGVDPVELSPVVAAADKTGDELTEEWVKLKQVDPKAATAFYDKNRSAILKAAGL